jgi:hypothetical protein
MDWMDDLNEDLSDNYSSENDFDRAAGHNNFSDIFFGTEDLTMNDEHLGEVIGNPEEWAYYYSAQTLPDSCAVVAQQGILKTFGIDVTESELVNYAEDAGIYVPGQGTTLDDVGDILDHFGVKNERLSGGELDNLVNELKQGNRVIVGLDANEIWVPEASLNPFNNWKSELPDAGHAVWVTGIDEENGVVYMNDSGVPDGQGRKVDIDDFLNAWEDYDNYYCVTRV